MFEREVADRLEAKLDRITDSLHKLNVEFASHIELDRHTARMTEENRELVTQLKVDSDKGRGALGLLSLVTVLIGAVASATAIFKH